MHGIVRDSIIVMNRELRPTLRDPVSVAFSLIQPPILLAQFGPLLKAVPAMGEGVWNWFVPGVLVTIASPARRVRHRTLSPVLCTGIGCA
jgi:ABC-2 type transport system permease protein